MRLLWQNVLNEAISILLFKAAFVDYLTVRPTPGLTRPLTHMPQLPRTSPSLPTSSPPSLPPSSPLPVLLKDGRPLDHMTALRALTLLLSAVAIGAAVGLCCCRLFVRASW